MVKLVKLFIVVFAVTISTESFGQIFRVKAGVNFANMVVKDDDDNYSEDFKMKPGFHFGASAEIPIGELLAFEPGLLYSLKGFKFKEEDSGDEIVLTWNLSYIEIPLNLKATFDVGTVRIYTLLGPYIGIGLTGKSKVKFTYMGNSETEKEDINWGSDEDEDELKRFDFGLNIGAGVELDAFQIGLSYGMGLANISPYTGNGMKINNRVLAITGSYRIGE